MFVFGFCHYQSGIYHWLVCLWLWYTYITPFHVQIPHLYFLCPIWIKEVRFLLQSLEQDSVWEVRLPLSQMPGSLTCFEFKGAGKHWECRQFGVRKASITYQLKRGGGGNSWWGKVRENWKGEHDTKKKWIKKLNEIKKIPQRRYPWVGGTDGGLMWIYCQHDFKKLLTNKKINKADNTDIASGFRCRERNAKENRRTQALQTVWIPSSAYINGTL